MLRWFDRRFSFEFPTELASAIIERLRGTPGRLRERVAGLDRDALVDQSAGWSIQEHVGHLLDLEPLWLGRVDDFLVGEERLRPADLTNARTHEANHNDKPLPRLLDDFERERRNHVARLESLAVAEFGRVARHPRLDQPMRLVDSCYFVAEHDDHHLAVITRQRPAGRTAT